MDKRTIAKGMDNRKRNGQSQKEWTNEEIGEKYIRPEKTVSNPALKSSDEQFRTP